jgi:hypothetical protein
MYGGSAETGDGMDDLSAEFFQACEGVIDAMHLRVRSHPLGALAKCVQLPSFCRVEFNVSLAHWVPGILDEQQDRPAQPLSFIELEFREGDLVGIPLGVRRRLTILAADHANERRRIPYHLERRIDDIHELRRIVLHRDIGKPLALKGADQRRPMLLQVRESAGYHHSVDQARRGTGIRHHSTLWNKRHRLCNTPGSRLPPRMRMLSDSQSKCYHNR